MRVCTIALASGVIEDTCEEDMVRVFKKGVGMCNESTRNALWEGLSEEARVLFIERKWI